MNYQKVRLGIVGCGDVAFRVYLPTLAQASDDLTIVGCCDLDLERAERAAQLCRAWNPDVQPYHDVAVMFETAELDAIINITPPAHHYEVTRAALDSGLHVFSEKPLAGSVEEGLALIQRARQQQLVLMCAPAIMATSRFRYLHELIKTEAIGRITLATGHMANLGPAAWRAYTGSVQAAYGEQGGPVIDTGVYVLHAITGLLGPARRVQAMGGITIPRRTILAEVGRGEELEVRTYDHVLIQLDFGTSSFAQITSSYAITASKHPMLELYGTAGTISVTDWYKANGAVDVFRYDSNGPGGWNQQTPTLESATDHVVAAGPLHFIASLRGQALPLLSAEHACHVLEIMLKARQSIAEGRTIELETSF